MANTPGALAKSAMDTISKEILFKKPTGSARKRRKETILDEDTYVEQIGKIIQRDFFPDLEKLRAQNEYLAASERNDLTKMRELYMKYSGNRPPTQRIPSPATFETPRRDIPTPQPSETIPCDPQNTEKHLLSLDQFLNSHTSQDNQSFSEILEESERKHQHKYHYLYNEESKSDLERLEQLTVPSIEAQAGEPLKKLNLDTWTYKNKNYIMYTPEGVPLTPEAEMEMLKNKQEVVHSNTRLSNNPFNENKSKGAITQLAKSQSRVLDGKVGVDGKEMVGGTPHIGGFSLVRTPSPAPGALVTPLMTWGEIEGTPFRLDGSDTPRPSHTPGPAFKMSEPGRREQLAMALAEKVGEKNREKRFKAMNAARRLVSPSPRRLSALSPAARRFGAKLGYSPSPSLSGGFSATPKTPKTPTSRNATPKLNLGIRKPMDELLTDDLLKIKVPKRNAASDFF